MNNMLYDKATKRLTAVLDFDWSCVAHPAEEFLTGLWDIGGGLSDRVGKLLPNILSGNFPLPPEDASDDEKRNWEVAKAWNVALATRGAIRPSAIAGISQVQALAHLEQLLCPFDLASPVMLKRRSDEDNAKRLADVEKEINDWFEVHGFPLH
jgi:aminoglycoside phosphotransferase (APT) family kinase protein